MAQADWASGVQLRRLLLVVMTEGGLAHDNRGSSIRIIHLAFTLASASVVSLIPPYRTFALPF